MVNSLESWGMLAQSLGMHGYIHIDFKYWRNHSEKYDDEKVITVLIIL